MIGNDIIDLAVAQRESNWQRKGFLPKLFTAREQYLILKSPAPEIMVWNLWSRKEAAYKIYNRQTGIRSFMPFRLECYDLDYQEGFVYGKVTCLEQTYHTRTKITSEYIETVAVLHPVDFHNIAPLTPFQKVFKIDGIPYCYNKQLIHSPVSISHHGRFERRITLSE